MATGFYCTVIRQQGERQRVGWLLGPYGTKAEAEGHVWRAQASAQAIDPRCAWDSFGVTRLERDGELPPGVLNSLIELDGELTA